MVRKREPGERNVRIVRLLLAFVATVAVTSALAVAIHSQFVMAGLCDLGSVIVDHPQKLVQRFLQRQQIPDGGFPQKRPRLRI